MPRRHYAERPNRQFPEKNEPQSGVSPGTSALAYLRVSTQEQARGGVSLDAQDERIRAYCTLAGLTLVDVLREEGVSGAKPLASREHGAELARRVQSGEAKHVVTFKLDRLFRDAADALRQTREWDQRGVAVHFVDLGGQTLNTASAMGRMFLTVAAGFAELERNLIAERTAMALAHKREHGLVYGSTPFGYERRGDRLREKASELRVLKRIRAWRARGWSLRRIAEQLTADQVATKRGGRWHASSIAYLLKNPLYAGGQGAA